jgi:tetratricopeptide (TPR) repeat protein
VAIDREKIIANAQKLIDKKRFDKAVLEYQKIVAEDPSDARMLLKVGDLQSKAGTYPEAIATYERVGKLYESQGFALKAIAVFKQVRELIQKHAPQLEDKYVHVTPALAELYKQLGLISDALATLDEVATRLQSQQRDREAVGVLEKVVELDPMNPLPHLRLAEGFSRLGDVDSAVREFALATKQLIDVGRRDDAIKVLERSLHLKPDMGQARNCADLYIARGTREDGLKALAKLQTCFQADPKNIATLNSLSKAFSVIGQAQKGLEVQKEIARIARDTGDIEMFQETVRKLRALAPNDETVQRFATQAGLIAAQPAASPAPPPAAPTAQPASAFASTQLAPSPSTASVQNAPNTLAAPRQAAAGPGLGGIRAPEPKPAGAPTLATQQPAAATPQQRSTAISLPPEELEEIEEIDDADDVVVLDQDEDEDEAPAPQRPMAAQPAIATGRTAEAPRPRIAEPPKPAFNPQLLLDDAERLQAASL